MRKAAGVFALCMMIGGTAASEDGGIAPSLERLTGTYAYAGDKTRDRAAIDAQIKAATANMSALVSRIAHSRLQAGNPIPERLSISAIGNDIRVEMDDHAFVAAKGGGERKTKNLAGHTVNLSFHVKKAQLVQDLVQSRGERINVFRFNDAGQLVMRVKESSPELAASVEYDLVYKRASKK